MCAFRGPFLHAGVYFVGDFFGQLRLPSCLVHYACQQALSPACVRCGVTVLLEEVHARLVPGPALQQWRLLQ